MAFWKHTYHLVWATKNRQPIILPEFEARLYAYLASKAGELESYLHAIGGMDEHLHIVASIPPKHAVAHFVKTLKGASAHFVNHVIALPALHFAWQEGYGSLTVGERHRAIAINYVLRQKEHHLHGMTNAWLERCEPLPILDQQNGEAPITSVREESINYEIDPFASFPF
jgi:putative transposase